MKQQNSKKTLSKQSRLIRLLSRVKGGSIIQLEQELEWQPHTIRGAICRLRKSGKNIATGKTGAGTTVYRLLAVESVEA